MSCSNAAATATASISESSVRRHYERSCLRGDPRLADCTAGREPIQPASSPLTSLDALEPEASRRDDDDEAVFTTRAIPPESNRSQETSISHCVATPRALRLQARSPL